MKERGKEFGEKSVELSRIVEIAEVTVPIGSSCTPAIAAPLDTPPSARATNRRVRIAAARIPLGAYPFVERQTRIAKDEASYEAQFRLKWTF